MLKINLTQLKGSPCSFEQMEILPNQSIGIISPADSGKSALLIALLGQSILGTLFEHNTKLKDYDIAYVPTTPSHIFSGMKSTLEGELSLSSQLIGRLPTSVESIAKKFDILHLLNRDPFTLSGGEMVRASLAINAVTEPKIWLLDQIYDWLYPESIQYIRSLMLHELSMGHAVVETHSYMPKWFNEFDVVVRDLQNKTCHDPKQPSHQVSNTYQDINKSKQIERGASDELVLCVRDFKFQYPKNGFKIGPVDLDCYAGDIVAIIGENGSGKTTLLQCLANLNLDFQGKLSVYGSSPSEKNWEWAGQVIYCFQNPDDQLYNSTVLDEVKVTLRALKRNIPDDLSEKLETFGLTDYLDFEPYHLARPIRRMVCFAATMLSESPVVLLDEPTANLDHRFKDIVLSKIHDTKKKCHVIMMVSHDTAFVSKAANRIIEMKNGLIINQP